MPHPPGGRGLDLRLARQGLTVRRLLPLAALAALAGCGAPEPPERVPVTVYGVGPPGDSPALEALRGVLADAGGTAGAFRVTLSWQAVAPDAPRGAVLAAARRAVEDPRAVAYVDATGGPASVEVVQLLNLAGVAVAQVESLALQGPLCTSRDPFPSGRRTAAVPAGATPADRARTAARALLDVLRPMPPAFDRAAITAALTERLSTRC